MALDTDPIRKKLNTLGTDQIRSFAERAGVSGTGTKSSTKLIDMIINQYKKMSTNKREGFYNSLMSKKSTTALGFEPRTKSQIDIDKKVKSGQSLDIPFPKFKGQSSDDLRTPKEKRADKLIGMTKEADRKAAGAKTEKKPTAMPRSGPKDKVADTVPTPRRRPGKYEAQKLASLQDKNAAMRSPEDTDAGPMPSRLSDKKYPGFVRDANKPKTSSKPKRSAPKRTDNSEALADRLTARMMELQNKGMSNKEATEELKKERAAGKFAKGGSVKKKKVATKKSNKGAQDFRGDYGCTMSTVDNRKKRK